MTDESNDPQDIIYPHPANLDLDPADVGRAAAQQLRLAAKGTAEHAVAVGRQVRSSYLSQLIEDEGNLAIPEWMADQWGHSDEARQALNVIKAAAKYKHAAEALALTLERKAA